MNSTLIQYSCIWFQPWLTLKKNRPAGWATVGLADLSTCSICLGGGATLLHPMMVSLVFCHELLWVLGANRSISAY